MADTLKGANRLTLASFFAANLALFAFVMSAESLVPINLASLTEHFERLLPAGMMLTLTGVFAALLPNSVKERLIFWRIQHPMPGSFAFTKYRFEDTRIDPETIEANFGPLPTEPAKQNSLWYKLYRTISDIPEVSDVHREFLLFRDMASIAILLLPPLGLTSFYYAQSRQVALGYIMLLAMQYLLTAIAAQNRGKRFVCTVLALKSAGR